MMAASRRELVLQALALLGAVATAIAISLVAANRLTYSTSDDTPRSLDAEIEEIGLFPERHFQFDRGIRGRMYAGGAASDDGGRSWSPLEDQQRGSITLLGGTRSRPIALSDDHRVLCAEVLFSRPGEALGRGEISHAVEWHGHAWHDVLPAHESWARPQTVGVAAEGFCCGDDCGTTPSQASPPGGRHQVEQGLPVVAVAYGPNGQYAVLTRSSIVWPSGCVETPGPAQTLLLASDGTVYVGLTDREGFDFFYAERLGAPWKPIGGVSKVHTLCETRRRQVLAAGPVLSRGLRAAWAPISLRGRAPRRIVAHPSQDLVVAIDSGLLVSTDDGRTFRRVGLPPAFDVEWAEVDPFRDSTIVCLSSGRHAFRVHVASAP